MRSLLVLCAVVAIASAVEELGSGIGGGEVSVTELTADAPAKEHPTNDYQYKYALGDVEKELLLTLNLGGDSDDVNKAYFEYTISRGQIYRTDYLSDAGYKEHVL